MDFLLTSCRFQSVIRDGSGRYFEFLGHKFLGTAVAVQLLGLRFGVASARGKSGHCLIWTLASKNSKPCIHIPADICASSAHMY